MNWLRIRQLALVAAATTLPGACVDEQPTAPADQEATGSTQRRRYRGPQWGELGHLIPGYGGHFVQANDKVVWVYLLDPETQAERAKSVFSGREVFWTGPPKAVRILQGRYGVFELLRWKGEVASLTWDGGDIYGVGLGFDVNRVNLYVEPGTDFRVVRRRVRALGVPVAAVRILEMEQPLEL